MHTKRVFCVVLLLLAVGLLPHFSAPARTVDSEEMPQVKIDLYLNGRKLHFEVEPRLREGEVYIPLRGLFEAMGYVVEWQEERRMITIYGQEGIVILYLDSELYAISGSVKRLQGLLFVERGRTLVHLDFLRSLAVADQVDWHPEEQTLEILAARGETVLQEKPVAELQEYANFIEVQLSGGEQVEVGDSFALHVGAPFIPGIHTFEVRLHFDPSLLQVKDIYSPSFQAGEDFFRKDINNNEGRASYTQSLLGFRDSIPSRKDLVVVRAETLQAGVFPIEQETLEVVLLDNEARNIPISKEEVTLLIGPQAGEPAQETPETL